MKRSAPLLALTLSLPLLLAATLARADGAKGANPKAGRAAAAAPPKLSPKYRDACTQGNTKYAARDFAGAIEAYRQAIELDPKNPLGHYLLGEAQLAAGNLTEAEAAWNRASLESGDTHGANVSPAAATVRARILFVLADLKERQKKWDDAKAAWQMYLDWAAKYPNAGAFPASAQSRQQVIDTMQKLDTSYAVVRQRIAETKDGKTFTDLSKQPAAEAK